MVIILFLLSLIMFLTLLMSIRLIVSSQNSNVTIVSAVISGDDTNDAFNVASSKDDTTD